MYDIIKSAYNFFLPRFCPSCNKKLTAAETYICSGCLSKIKLPGEELIRLEYDKKFAAFGIISGFTSLFVFEKDKELQPIIHSLKYNNKFLIGKFLGGLLGRTLFYTFSNWNIDLIIPVPLHHIKKAERGYNQSFYIAKGLSTAIKKPFSNKALKRTRFTKSQTTMSLLERKANITGAFEIKRELLIKNKNLLLVDDVITTGATVQECSRVLKKHGAKSVFAASIAIAE